MALEKLVLHATNLRIPVVEVEGGSLTAVAGFDGHQGIALIVAPRRWAGVDDILAVAAQRAEPALVLVLDSLEDPQNFGTVLRTAEASGVHGAIFPTHHQAPLSPAAIKASAGAVEHLQLAQVDDLAGTIADLHARGLRIVGADGDASLTAREADLRGPIAIVIGSEGRGLGSAVRRRCDLLVRIPMHGRIESLNAAVAGSILLYEAAAQRGAHGERPLPSATVLGTEGIDDEPEAPDTTEDGAAVTPDALAAADEPAPDPVTAESDAGLDVPVLAPEPPAKPKRASRARATAVAPDAHVPAGPEAPGGRPPASARTRGKTTRTRPSAAKGAPHADPERDPADDLLPGGPPVDDGGQAQDVSPAPVSGPSDAPAEV